MGSPEERSKKKTTKRCHFARAPHTHTHSSTPNYTISSSGECMKIYRNEREPEPRDFPEQYYMRVCVCAQFTVCSHTIAILRPHMLYETPHYGFTRAGCMGWGPASAHCWRAPERDNASHLRQPPSNPLSAVNRVCRPI